MRLGLLVIAVLLIVGVVLRESQRTSVTQVPDELEALVTCLHEARTKQNTEMLKRIGRSLIPTTDELRQVLRAGEATEAWIQANRVRDLRPGEQGDRMAVAFARAILRGMAGARNFSIHAASRSTEMLAAGRSPQEAPSGDPGGGAPAGDPKTSPIGSGSFTAGDRSFAETVAAPGRSWHVVEIRDEAGKQRLGAPLRLLTKLEGRWIYLAMPTRR